MGMTHYERDLISNIICYVTLDEDHEHQGLPKPHTHRALAEAIIACRLDRVCSVKCIKFGHEMPGAMNTHTEPTWHNIGMSAFEGYEKHTHRALAEAIIARRLDRVCSVKCIKIGHEMPGSINAHTESTWHIGMRTFEGYQKHTHTQLRPNRSLWSRVDRVCSVKCIKFGHNMPGAMNTHGTEMAQDEIWRLWGLQKTHTHNVDRTDHCGGEWIAFVRSSA